MHQQMKERMIAELWLMVGLAGHKSTPQWKTEYWRRTKAIGWLQQEELLAGAGARLG